MEKRSVDDENENTASGTVDLSDGAGIDHPGQGRFRTKTPGDREFFWPTGGDLLCDAVGGQ